MYTFLTPKKLSAPDQRSSSYEALWDSKRCWESTVAGNIRLFRWLTMSFASPISPNLSSWSKVIIMRQERFQGSRRKRSEIYLPVGASVWPRSRHKSAASCFCERRFNLIKSRLMACWLASLELQQKLSEGQKHPPPEFATVLLLVNSRWNIGRKQSRLLWTGGPKCTLRTGVQGRRRGSDGAGMSSALAGGQSNSPSTEVLLIKSNTSGKHALDCIFGI